MPIITEIRVISLGTHRDLDPNESVLGAERAAELVGRTFGSTTDPLARSIFALTLNDGNSDGTISFNSARGNPPGEFVTVNGETHYLDTGILYTGTVRYMDGTSATGVPLRVLQDTQGNLVLLPPPRNAPQSEIDALTQKPIASIQLTAVRQNDFTGLNSSRYGLEGEPAFVCFVRGTLIATDRGDVAVESLRPGDLVRTRDNGLQPLRWIGSQKVGPELLGLFPALRPVRMAAGSLGADLPRRDLRVSQQHRMLVDSRIAERVLGAPEVLVAAKHLTEIPGIQIEQDSGGVEYFHLLFDRHEIIWAEGALTESLFTGPQALKSVGPAARAEIIALFPELSEPRHQGQNPARPLGQGRKARQLVARHAAHQRELQRAPSA